MKTKLVNCYNCNGEKSEEYDIENGHIYVKCSTCGLIYLNPRPSNEEISSSHKIGMHRGDSVINVTGKYKAKKVKKYLNILKDLYPKGTLKKEGLKWLDIGYGFGEFIEALNITGKDYLVVKGSEPNKHKVSSCVDRGLDVDFIELAEHDEKYDFISLLNVFSHLPDPVKFIKDLKSKLNPEGEILLETGHSSHLPSKFHHKPYYAPDHLSFANQTIVEDIFKRNGFDIVKTVIYRHEQFPKFFDIRGIVIQIVKIILRKNGSIKNLFPKYPNRDIFIRAKLKGNKK